MADQLEKSMAAAKMKPIHEAYTRCEEMRRAFSEMGARCMEVTEDRYGILWERWLLPSGASAVLWATPHGWDVFLPANGTNSTEATIEAVKRAAA
jgi:hypothetical protein